MDAGAILLGSRIVSNSILGLLTLCDRVNVSPTLLLRVGASAWPNQKVVRYAELLAKTADHRQGKQVPAIQDVRNAGFVPQVLLHIFTAQSFLIYVGEDDFHQVIGRLDGVVLRFIVANEKGQ